MTAQPPRPPAVPSSEMQADDDVSTSRRALGQVIEWLVWSAIVGHSERTTHVFLPLDDRGVDGIVRRVDDEAMCAVQVKGRTSIAYSELRTVVRRSALDDPHVTFVVALLDPASITLGETVYVMDAEAVLARRNSVRRAQRSRGGAEASVPAQAGLQVDEIRVPAGGAARASLRLSGGTRRRGSGVGAVRFRSLSSPHRRGSASLVGHLAELEVMRLLGEPATLNTFKSFPDLEEAEYLVRHRPSGNIRGIQVKCLIVPDADYRGGVDFHGPSFAPSSVTDAVVLAWREDIGAFDDRAWLIPTIDIPKYVSTEGYTFRLPLRVSEEKPGRFDPYRVVRGHIPRLIEARTAPPTGVEPG